MSDYAKKMEQLSRQIFNEVVSPTEKTSMRVVERHSYIPLYKNPHYVKWYPRLSEITKLMGILRDHGLYRDEHLDFREEYARLRILRGKMPFVPKDKRTGEKIIRKVKTPEY
ncbi:unnamed protein product [Gordionus sp. m RMFG-2023]